MGHGHHGASGMAHRGRLRLVLAVTLAVVVIQGAGAFLTGSLALLADAGHMLSDSFGLFMALAAIGLARLPGSDRRSFGYHRTEVIAAGLNGLLLLGLCLWILFSAIRRLGDVPELDATAIGLVGLLGLAANAVGIVLLHNGAKQNLNVRGAYLEVVGDALGSVAVIASAIVISLTGWYQADVVASLLIAVLIVPRAVSLLRDVGNVLLEGAPKDLDLKALQQHMIETDGVADIHDVHVWTLTSGMPVMSAHIVVEDGRLDDSPVILERLRGCLADHFDLEHSTLQIETAEHAASEVDTHH